MDIWFRVTFGERDAVSLLNWLARCNARLIRERPDLPRLYEAGVRYEREKVETWCDYVQLLAQRWEDCDGLAAARAGELLAVGHRALAPGDPGYKLAKTLGLWSIKAEVALTTKVRPGEHGLYHCVVHYRVGREWFWDDPSARLGMLETPLTGLQCHQRLKKRVRMDGLYARGLPATHQQRLAANIAAKRQLRRGE